VPVAALLDIPSHAGAITVRASLICSVCEMFHPSIHCVTEEDSHTRTEMKMCCFDFIVFLMQVIVTGTVHASSMADDGQFTVVGLSCVAARAHRCWSPHNSRWSTQRVQQVGLVQKCYHHHPPHLTQTTCQLPAQLGPQWAPSVK
jgi:hypothetical protein